MENGLSEVLQDQEAQGHSGVGEQVRRANEKQVKAGVLDPRGHFFAFDLLEVQFGEDVEPISDLDDVEELEHE